MWLTCVSQLQPLVVWICIQSGTWKTQQPRQTMDRWLIRCVRLLSEKVRAEIKCHFEHPTGVYWKGAGMQRMSAVWVSFKDCQGHILWAPSIQGQSSFQRMDAGNPHLSISPLRIMWNNIYIACVTWESRSPMQTVLIYSMYVQTFAAEVHRRPQVKVPTVTDSQRLSYLDANMLN